MLKCQPILALLQAVTQTTVQIPGRDISDWIIYGSNLLLAFTAIVGIIVGVRTLKNIERQSDAAEDAAKAAKDSAEAALLNAQAFINSERPWVTVFAQWKPEGGYSFRACNLGKTPAEIVSFSAEFVCLDDINELSRVPEFKTLYVPVIRLLVPGGQLGQADIELLSRQEFNGRISECKSRKKRLPVFYFRIRYANPLSRTRPDIPDYESRMCFTYAFGDLTVCGSEEYNRHT